MAWHNPSLHRVSAIRAGVSVVGGNDTDDSFVVVVLTIEQGDSCIPNDKATLSLFLSLARLDYAHALAEAINSVIPAAQPASDMERAA